MGLTRKLCAVLGLVMLLAASACQMVPASAQVQGDIEMVSLKASLPRQTSPQVTSGDISQLSAGGRAFAANLYRQLSTQDGNLFFSPYSISTSLSMMEAGAGSTTRQQIDRALHFDLPAGKLQPAFNSLSQQIEKSARQQASDESQGQAFKLQSANAIWLQKGLDVENSFLQTLAENYGDGVKALDFHANPEAARQLVNQWIAEQTAGKITEAIPSGGVTDATRLALTGAVYFKGAWLVAFDPSSTQGGKFNLSNGQAKTVPMMSAGSSSFQYARGSGWQLVELPYASQNFSMDLLLPDEGQLASFEQSLSGATLDSILQQAQDQPGGVEISLPRFKFDSAFSLRDALTPLGLTSAFDPHNADFSGIHSGGGLYLDNIYHRAVVSVDENGTEASAASTVFIPATGGLPTQPVKVTFDRPFLFLIREHITGAVLFMGRVSNP